MRTWVDAGYEATNFDIKVSKSHDMCAESGVKALLTRGLEPLGQEIKLLSLSKFSSLFYVYFVVLTCLDETLTQLL